MSTLKVQSVQHASAASPAITLDANGQATLNGLAFPTSGSLSGRNRIINGDMRIDQRNAGASVAASGITLDRWTTFENTSASSVTAQRSTIAPSGFTNSLLYTVGTGGSAGASEQAVVRQRIEGFNVADMAFGTASAQNITVSFRVRSSVTGTYSVAIQNSAGDRSYVAAYTVDAANTWEAKAITIAGDVSGTWLTDNGIGMALLFDLGSGSSFNTTAGAWAAGDFRRVSGQANVIGTTGATFYITGVQLEAGTVATPFERRSYGQELALCQRYCVRLNESSQTYGITATSSAVTTTDCYVTLPFTLRASPTITYANLQLFFGTAKTVSAISAATNLSGTVTLLVTSSTLTAGQAGILQQSNSTSGYLQLSSEL